MSTSKPLPVASGQTKRIGRWRAYLPDVAAFACALISAALAAVLLGSLHGCGGGVGGEGTGGFASGTLSTGPITGFGSVVVNGVRFDDTNAAVVDDDGAALARTALGLGAVVQVTGGAVTTAADGSQVSTASKVQINRALVGPVSQVSVSTGRLVVLGQTVRTTANTVMDVKLSNGLASLGVGQQVEVYGSYDGATASYVATRIGVAPDGATPRVRGTVASVDTTGKTFNIGSQTFSFASLSSTSGLSNGATVQVALQTSGTDSKGRWVVGNQSAAPTPLPVAGESCELRGVVSSVSSGNRFVVEGVTVDASAAKISGTVAVGASVEVSGTSRNGLLVATDVQVEDDSVEKGFELRGAVTQINTSTKRLVLRDTTVSYARSNIIYTKGTAANLAVGRLLRVVGVLSADRTVLEATEIRFDD